MESSTVKRKTFAKPRPLTELLPSLRGIFSNDERQTFTDKKQPRPAGVQTLTNRSLKPMSYHDMRASLLALKPSSPKASQPSGSRKKDWVSSIKVDYKSVSHTANGQMRNHPVRKVLNFQPPKPKAPNPRMTLHNTETPKFPKPEYRPKKSVYAQAKNNINVRISGICEIPETPLETKPNPPKRITIANKENNPYQDKQSMYKGIKKKPVLPTPILRNPRKVDIDTPADSSWKSNDNDTSFLLKEKEIQEQLKATTIQDISKIPEKVSTPSSTPFKDYRSVQEYFNNSSEVESSVVYNDNTIMCFDKPSDCKEDSKREESLVGSLCELFTKATVNTDNVDKDLDALIEMETQIESNIRMLDSGIQMLNNIKQTQLESLKRINRLKEEHNKNAKAPESEMDKTLVSNEPEIEKMSPEETSPIVSKPCSVIKVNNSFKSNAAVKSPTYKVPKKNVCLRKKLVYKSMPNISPTSHTPVKDINGKALNVYMKLKENMNFLSTPMVNRAGIIPDTPMVTSHNLQKQLDKLYNGS